MNMKMAVKNLDNKQVGEVELEPAVFEVKIKPSIVHRAIVYQRAKSRSGNHQAKTISMISGTTAKPWKQKGTGRARQGSLRSPQFRGGAVIFGPVVRSHAIDLPKKVRRLALKIALSSKVADGKCIVIDNAKLASHKTKDIVKKLKGIGVASSALVIDGANLDENFVRAVKNLQKINVLPEGGANVYDIVRHDVLVLTRNAVEQLGVRLK